MARTATASRRGATIAIATPTTHVASSTVKPSIDFVTRNTVGVSVKDGIVENVTRVAVAAVSGTTGAAATVATQHASSATIVLPTRSSLCWHSIPVQHGRFGHGRMLRVEVVEGPIESGARRAVATVVGSASPVAAAAMQQPIPSTVELSIATLRSQHVVVIVHLHCWVCLLLLAFDRQQCFCSSTKQEPRRC